LGICHGAGGARQSGARRALWLGTESGADPQLDKHKMTKTKKIAIDAQTMQNHAQLGRFFG
jgi:hypothetical protein